MHDNQDERLPSLGELIENLLFYDWSSECCKINRTFLLLLDAYLGSEMCESANPEARQEIAFHLVMIHETIEKLKQLELLNTKKTA